jgi:hypothetical protein
VRGMDVLELQGMDSDADSVELPVSTLSFSC